MCNVGLCLAGRRREWKGGLQRFALGDSSRGGAFESEFLHLPKNLDPALCQSLVAHFDEDLEELADRYDVDPHQVPAGSQEDSGIGLLIYHSCLVRCGQVYWTQGGQKSPCRTLNDFAGASLADWPPQLREVFALLAQSFGIICGDARPNPLPWWLRSAAGGLAAWAGLLTPPQLSRLVELARGFALAPALEARQLRLDCPQDVGDLERLLRFVETSARPGMWLIASQCAT